MLDVGRITALALGEKTNLYIGTDRGNLVKLDLSNNQKTPQRVQLERSSNSIISMTFHKDILWIATNNGLFYTDKAISFLNTFRQENSQISNNHVTTIFGDKNMVWVGTYQGLDTITFVPFEIFNKQNSGIFEDVLAFEEDTEKNLWIGTFNGLYRYNKNTGKHTRFQELKQSIEILDERIMTLATRGKKLWLGFRKNGVQIVDTETLEITAPQLPSIQELEVTKIYHADSGSTWVGTFNHGLYQIKTNSYFSYLLNGLPERSVTVLLETKSGDIIAASERNFYKYISSSNSFALLNLNFGKENPSPLILSASENDNGDIWIGTKDQGLFIWRKQAQLTSDMSLEYVSANIFGSISTIYGIQFDTSGDAWCSTQSGIFKLNSRGDALARFTKYDGLQGSDFNFGSSFKDSNDQIYFGGSNGYNRFSPRDIETKRVPPKVLITGIGISKGGAIASFTGLDLTKIQLTHKDYFIQFEFSVLDFLDPEKNQYRYKLEGFDRSWVDNGTRNTATYTSLPAGKYTLRVQGANSAGIWNRDGLSIEIEVLPAPWLTWWAFTLYALGAMFLVWLATRTFFSFVVERRANELALEMVEVAEQADDEMLEQLEIHDDLVKSVYRHSVATLGLVSELMTIRGSSLTDDNACEVVQASVSRVEALALLEECLYYQGEFLLADMNKFINLLIPNLLKKSFLGEEKITTINEVISQPFPIEQASPLAIILFELLENSIQHGFVEIDRPNYLHIVLAPDQADDVGGQFRLVVEDNGAGIPPNIDPLSAPTNGLSIVVAMTRRLSGTLQVTNRNGTRVSVVFPAIGNMWRESAG